MSADIEAVLGRLEEVEKAMTPAPWQVGSDGQTIRSADGPEPYWPVDDPVGIEWNAWFERSACVLANDMERAEDVAGTAALRNAAPGLLRLARAAVAMSAVLLAEFEVEGHEREKCPDSEEVCLTCIAAEADNLRAAIEAFATTTEREPCTGLAATWRPVHGDCTCPLRDDGERDLNDYNCPLHGEASTHGA